ncbi:MAG: NADH-quinone oxidoreductase subunit N, partial [Micrococcales bacterium]|nr:NADH-quinone oxidoreductase subunit N [Micrococcales bacterium]
TVFINSLLSLFYYLRWIIPAFQPAPEPDVEHHRPDRKSVPGPWSSGTAVAAATASVLLGVVAGLAWTVASGPLLP